LVIFEVPRGVRSCRLPTSHGLTAIACGPELANSVSHCWGPFCVVLLWAWDSEQRFVLSPYQNKFSKR
jgi:hypothetical protein